MWAPGFVSDPIYPITIDCRGCPANPMSAQGSRARREYLATFAAIVDMVLLRVAGFILVAVVLAPLVAHAYVRVWPRR